MTTSGVGFARRSYSLLGGLVRSPMQVVSELPHLDTAFCIRFGFLCFFLSTALTALFQMAALDFFDFFLSDPQKFSQVAKAFEESVGRPLIFTEFQENLVQLRAIATLNLALSPFSAGFFPYLLSGALFLLLQVLAVTKSPEGTYDQLIKLVSISFGLFLFCAVPFIGPILGNVWWFIFIVRSTASLFEVPIFGRASATLLACMVLFSIWNATVARLATTLI